MKRMDFRVGNSLMVFLLSTSAAWAQSSVVWTADIEISTFSCSEEGIEKITVEGEATLVHPEATAMYEEPMTIKLDCPILEFNEGAILRTRSHLDVLVTGRIQGPVVIQSTRGQAGADAEWIDGEGIWAYWEEKSVPDPRTETGGKGQDGAPCENFGGGSSPGGPGPIGRTGAPGETGKKGPDGRAGDNGSNIRLIVNEFSPGATVKVTTNGGRGGAGGLGGVGERGGIGGKGGPGGPGGNGGRCHSSSKGGQGGQGGTGGRGGDGGPGGDGGDGGNGGRITVALKEGGNPTEALPDLTASLGSGGAPGAGGEPGQGGPGGPGGNGGRGGDGKWFNKDAQNGLAGIVGDPGEPGNPGPPGNPGRDGLKGVIGPQQWGTITLDQFEQAEKSW